MNILIVEDDKNIEQILSAELTKWGYQTAVISNFNNVVEEFEKSKADLILMDIILPYFNGYYWCQEIRKISNVPIVFVSSKSENMDIVMAMQFGGDDFITKPINLDIMIAKIQAILRRCYNFSNEISYIEFGNVQLYLLEAKLTYQNNEAPLTKTELMILEELFKAQGNIVSREKIMDRCWQSDNFIDDNTLAVNMTRVRKKLSAIGLENFISTKKGVGYMLHSQSF